MAVGRVCDSRGVAGVRRRLRDVGSRVSGVLGVLRDEVVPEVLGALVGEEAPAAQSTPAGDLAAAAPEEPDRPSAPTGPGIGDTGDVTSAPSPAAVLDEAAAAAVDLARAAAVEEAGPVVGEHLGADREDDHTVTHSFRTTDPAYSGWRWAVTVARAEGTDVVTVDEVVLLPGEGALLPPAWVPYAERVQPGDLGAGDLLPPPADDPRLVPAHAEPETEPVDELADDLRWELGLGRPRVLSREGRLDAAERWYEGDAGPGSPRAVAAPGRCGGCGFLVPLGGALRAGFGVCANEQAPDDGRVVALGHGCGAHSETPVELTAHPVADLVVDEVEYDFEGALVPGATAPTAEQPVDPSGDATAGPEASDQPTGVPEPPAGQPEPDAPAADPQPGPADEEQAEELGHS